MITLAVCAGLSLLPDPVFASTRVICNILTDNAFLGIIAVGMTFVILSGGIDLSVGSVIAFTGVFLAKAIGFWGISPLVAFPLVLVMGCAFGAFMGLLIDALKIPAFIITLAGMFFLRGVSYLVSEESIPINHPVYDTLSGLAWTIPGGGRLSAMGLLMLLVVIGGIFMAHRTRFGNQVYAIGGNATSANLMGISTAARSAFICSLPGWRRWRGSSSPSIPRRAMRWRALALSWTRLHRWLSAVRC
jgi:simple sugar transport system permease protein